MRMHSMPTLKELRGGEYSPRVSSGSAPQDVAVDDTVAQSVMDYAFRLELRAQGVRTQRVFAYTDQRRVAVKAGDLVEWEWRETSGHSVDLAMCFIRPGMTPGQELEIQAQDRLRAGGGRYPAPETGTVVFMFSNTFSWVLNKEIAMSVRRTAAKREARRGKD
jgi:plastocyanin